MLRRRAGSDGPELRILEAVDPAQPLPDRMVQKWVYRLRLAPRWFPRRRFNGLANVLFSAGVDEAEFGKMLNSSASAIQPWREMLLKVGM